MIIPCPHCGPRPANEFACRGDADNAADRPQPGADEQTVWAQYVYDRRNPAGDHVEIWQHVGGCRAHLRVQRNTATHAIAAVFMLGQPVEDAGDAAAGDEAEAATTPDAEPVDATATDPGADP